VPDPADWLDAQPALDILGGKWTLPIIDTLHRGPCRHRDLARTLGPGISHKMLSATLRRLESYELINREVHSDTTIIYTLAPLGRSLHPAVAQLSRWSRKHRGELPGTGGKV
jgi:DNA-binding HxlR family transcriptional regulator